MTIGNIKKKLFEKFFDYVYCFPTMRDAEVRTSTIHAAANIHNTYNRIIDNYKKNTVNISIDSWILTAPNEDFLLQFDPPI